MATKLEETIARRLRDLLGQFSVGDQITYNDEVRDALVCLEYFVTEVIRERHPEWKHESLDGILPFVMRKTAVLEIELIGNCILITDQSLTPVHFRIQVAKDQDEICWMECRLGERTNGEMKRIPYAINPRMGPLLNVAGDVNAMDWYYAVTFGRKEST
ncbi:MAG: hypothetical protein WD468_07525 [Pirellulales bacterium]